MPGGRSGARLWLVLHKLVLWTATIPHAMHMTEPHETALAQEEMHAHCAGLYQNSCVCDPVLPSDVKDAAEAAKVEALKTVFLFSVCGPGFATVQKGTGDARMVHFQLSVQRQSPVGPHPLVQSGHHT